MAFNGSGSFQRDNGTHQGTTVWQNDRDAGANILASRHDSHDQDLANGLSNCICKDGQQTVTANIPFAGFKLQNIGAGTARVDAARVSQVQDGALVYGGTSGGSSNAYTISLSPAITSYVAGMMILFIANHSNTGTATLNVNGVGAANIFKGDGGNSLRANDIVNGQIVIVAYNGSEFIMLSQLPPAGSPIYTGLNLSGLTASQVIATDSSKELSTPGASTIRSLAGAAASGSNSDITALTGIPILGGAWSVSISASGSMTVSSPTTHWANYQRIGPWIYFQVTASFTLAGTADSLVQLAHPVAGVAHDANCEFPCIANENGTAITGARWRYDGTNIIIYKPGVANWTLGANAKVSIDGKYRAV